MAIETPCSTAASCSEDEINDPLHDQKHPETMPHMEDWYREPGAGKKTPDGRRRRRAKERCWQCPIRLRCLDAALAQGIDQQHGIWGGYDEAQRVAILKELELRQQRRAWANAGHSSSCIEVALISGLTVDDVHDVGGVNDCPVAA